jgi:hypothetical protein
MTETVDSFEDMSFIVLFQVACILACLVTAACAAAPNNTVALCQALNEHINGEIFTQNETDYETLRTDHWAQSAWAYPTCIFRPSSLAELQSVVPQLVNSQVKFSIRSGGHAPHRGMSSIDGGVLVDMSLFNELQYDAASQTARIGTGLRWGEVHSLLEQYEVTVVGGRIADVGVGGLTLGSGLSWLSNLYGLVCDNVVNFEVVLANGTVVNANADTHVELFWALKGGANNFGIVTALTLSTFPIYQVWGGFRSYTIEDLPALMDAMFEYQSTIEKDPYANLMILASPTDETVGVMLTLIYLKPQVFPAAFEPFYRINSTLDTTGLQTLASFIISNPIPEMAERFDWSATSLKPNRELYQRIANASTHSPAVDRIKSVEGGFMAVGFQPISVSVVDAGRARGGNALGLQPVSQTWALIDAAWSQPGDDAQVHEAKQSLMSELESDSRRYESYLPYLFMNDASWDQDVIASYGEDQVRRLRLAQALYDPEQVFQRLVPGYFKLP